MTMLKIYLDEEMELALIEDAGRNLRGAGPHAKALLRQALGLPFPYPSDSDMKKPHPFEAGRALEGMCFPVREEQHTHE